MKNIDVDKIKRQIEQNGVDSLIINDLSLDDLDNIAWSGGPAHPEAVRKALERVRKREVDYLAVRSSEGKPISIGGIDYTAHEGAGTLWQLATHEGLRGLGLGTRLIAALEQKAKDRGLHEAIIGVESDNPRARALYERLGYRACGHEQDTWQEIDNEGRPYTYHAEVDLLQKSLIKQ